MDHGTDSAQEGHGARAFRGLILDFAGVLTEEVRPVHRAWCVGEGLDAQAWWRTLNATDEGRRLYAELEVGRLSQAEWNTATAALMGLADGANLMGRAWAGVRAAERMVALARAARAAGYRLGLLSNSFGLDPFDPYRALGVWDLFDVHVISELEGIAKPDPAIYQLALDRMKLRPDDCVFVDDHAVNLPPAEALGITTVHAVEEGPTVERLEELLMVRAACASLTAGAPSTSSRLPGVDGA